MISYEMATLRSAGGEQPECLNGEESFMLVALAS